MLVDSDSHELASGSSIWFHSNCQQYQRKHCDRPLVPIGAEVSKSQISETSQNSATFKVVEIVFRRHVIHENAISFVTPHVYLYVGMRHSSEWQSYAYAPQPANTLDRPCGKTTTVHLPSLVRE